MHIISVRSLRNFWLLHADAEGPLRAWHKEARAATWTSPQHVRDQYANASIVANNRIVFNIKGNDYRLVVAVHYNTGRVFVRFVGTHREYNQIDAAEV